MSLGPGVGTADSGFDAPAFDSTKVCLIFCRQPPTKIEISRTSKFEPTIVGVDYKRRRIIDPRELIIAFRLRLPLAVNQCFTSTARAAIPSNSAKVCGDSVN